MYKLAEVLFTEAAKEKERRGNEYAKKPMKREIGNSDLTGGFSGGYTGDFTGDLTGDLSEDLTGDLMMPPPIPKSPSKGVLNDGAMPNSSPGLGPSAASPATPAGVTNLDGLDVIEMDGLGESLFQYNPGGEVGGGDFAGLDMDNYHAYAGGEEVYNGFEMGMVGEDFAPVGIGIPGLPHFAGLDMDNYHAYEPR